MTQSGKALGRYAREATRLAFVLLVAATTTVSAQPHGGGGGAMGGSAPFGGWMGLWPVVLVGLLAAVIVWAGGRRQTRTDRALAERRERYARGELSEDEFERRRQTLDP